MLTRALFVFLLLVFALRNQVAAFEVPFKTPSGQFVSQDFGCPSVPIAPESLALVSMYGDDDKTYSKVNQKALDEMNKQASSIREFTWRLSIFANAYTRSQGLDVKSGVCALNWLNSWASSGAMKDVKNHNAEFLRAVNLIGWSMAYAQIRRIETKNDYRKYIESWLSGIANDMVSHFDGLSGTTALNNHRYWAGLASSSVAMVTGDESLMRWGITSLRVGLRQINTEGVLPFEIQRGSRSGLYLIYASAPLIVGAEIAWANGVDLYSENDFALGRLADFSIRFVTDQSRVAALTGVSQLPISKESQSLAWIEYYRRRYPARVPHELDQFRPFFNAELGGDLSLLINK